jgi:Pyruvate/2-oxoacid:ferredoxin oxidoreductase delta subunit
MSSKGPFSTSKKEKNYLQKGKLNPDSLIFAHSDSVQEGFDYLFSTHPELTPLESKSFLKDNPIQKLRARGIPFRAIGSMLKIMRKIQKESNQSWTDIEPYFDNLSPAQFNPKSNLWNKLKLFIRENWDSVDIGFTELPSQMIFKGKYTLFRCALVASQEMKKDKIDQAPEFQAGKETMRVYSSLGLVVNKIARWLRKKGVRCQSNHPMGGLVNTPSLAGKAGMGWQGRSGLLITPKYGPRVRLAPIFIEHKYFDFTDNQNHKWIENYCKICQICEKKCPTKAINSKKIVIVDDVPGVGAIRTCIDREKCFEYFFKTLGCSICVKVCPFSKGLDTYTKLKNIIKTNQQYDNF